MLPLVGGIVIESNASDVDTIAEALAVSRADWAALAKLPASEDVRSVLSMQNRADNLSAVLTSLGSSKSRSERFAFVNISAGKGEK